jgi:signal transduction histidine kinase/CheY-like chemotaxis protein
LGSRSALRALECSAQGSPSSVIICGPDGVCGWANPAAAAWLGMDDCRGLVGRLDLHRHCSSPQDSSAIFQALGGQEVDRCPLTYQLSELALPAGSSNGGPGSPPLPRPVTAQARLVPLLDDHGAVVALCIFHETAQSVPTLPPKADSSLARASGAVSLGAAADDSGLRRSIATARDLAKRLAHDFNNIIAVVQGYAEMLETRMERDQEGRDMAAMIGKMGEEASLVTAKLARFASVTPLHPARLELNQAVRDFVTGVQSSAPAGVRVHMELADGLPALEADPDRLEQVFRNLWQNALDAMPQGGRMSWHTSLVQNPPQAGGSPASVPFVRLRVADTGVGMDDATRRHLFEPFFTTKHGRGRGLGLTEVYETVTEHEGCVEVTSAPNAGTCVDIYFPVERVAAQAKAKPLAAPPGAVAPEAAGPGRRWLVVDDNRLVRMLLQQFLVQAGCQALEAASGVEAIDICQHQGGQLDGVFLDLDLGEMKGAQVFQRLREIRSGIRVVIVTGDPYQSAVAEMRAQGNCGVLAKPFRREEVLGSIGLGVAAQQDLGQRAAA